MLLECNNVVVVQLIKSNKPTLKERLYINMLDGWNVAVSRLKHSCYEVANLACSRLKCSCYEDKLYPVSSVKCQMCLVCWVYKESEVFKVFVVSKVSKCLGVYCIQSKEIVKVIVFDSLLLSVITNFTRSHIITIYVFSTNKYIKIISKSRPSALVEMSKSWGFVLSFLEYQRN